MAPVLARFDVEDFDVTPPDGDEDDDTGTDHDGAAAEDDASAS